VSHRRKGIDKSRYHSLRPEGCLQARGRMFEPCTAYDTLHARNFSRTPGINRLDSHSRSDSAETSA
jgi:hypothetical protein